MFSCCYSIDLPRLPSHCTGRQPHHTESPLQELSLAHTPVLLFLCIGSSPYPLKRWQLTRLHLSSTMLTTRTQIPSRWAMQFERRGKACARSRRARVQKQVIYMVDTQNSSQAQEKPRWITAQEDLLSGSVGAKDLMGTPGR